jgi:hypothetical protein
MIYRKLEVIKSYERIIVVSFLFAIMIMTAGSASGFVKQVNAQKLQVKAQKLLPAQQYYAKNFVVYMTVYGLNSTTGQVFAFVNAHGASKNSLFNATKLDMMDNKTDGIGQAYFVFHNLTLSAGESYSGCVLSVAAAKMVCVTDFKSPYPRPQYMGISIR